MWGLIRVPGECTRTTSTYYLLATTYLGCSFKALIKVFMNRYKEINKFPNVPPSYQLVVDGGRLWGAGKGARRPGGVRLVRKCGV